MQYLTHWKLALVILTSMSLVYILYWTNKMSDYSHAEGNPWTRVPSFEIFIRMCFKAGAVYENNLVRSMKVFLPEDVRVVVVLDEESRKDHQLGEKIAKMWPYPRVHYEGPAPRVYNKLGHNRQQWSMFYPENYTHAEYVGYVDTDTAFSTLVTPEDLFENGKPHVRAVIGIRMAYMQSWARTTKNLFGDEFQIMTCMSYFPVIMKVQHIIELRKYLEKKYGMSFDAIFPEKIAYHRGFSQFNIMCQYIYHFHMDEYSFHLQTYPGRDMLGRLGTSEEEPPLSFYLKHFSEKEKSPFAAVSIHMFGHLEKVLKQFSLKEYFRQTIFEGICRSGGFVLCPQECSVFNKSSIHTQLFLFERYDWRWDPDCKDAQKEHYDNVKSLIGYYRRIGSSLFGENHSMINCKEYERYAKKPIKHVPLN